MHIKVEALRQQAWRSEKEYFDLQRYAKQIGCTMIQDEIIADDAQSRLLARWWQARHDGAW
jgi:hypothetical protein